MARAREPIFNISEPGPVRFAVVLCVLFAVFRYTALGNAESVLRFTTLRPAELMQGAGWLSVGGHAFGHGSWSHVLLNSVFLIVFSVGTLRGAREWAIRRGRPGSGEQVWIAVFLAGVIAGAFAQWAWWSIGGVFLDLDLMRQAAWGASGGVSGLLASAMFASGGRQMMLKVLLGWTVLNVGIGLFGGFGGALVAWPAHIGGYVGGMVLAPLLVAPGRPFRN